MKRIYAAILMYAAMYNPAIAETVNTEMKNTVGTPQVITPAVDPVEESINYLQQEWAHIKYQMPDKDMQIKAIEKLGIQAAALSSKYPSRADVKIWEGIILATDAGITKSISGLSKVKRAKALFEEALTINTNALNGSAYTSLGSLYYQVPGWPIGFGDKEKAEQYLKKALSINPNGIDPNYWYGDFLKSEKRYDAAENYLNKALQAPSRPGRDLADAGRRQEVKAALAEIAEARKTDGAKQYN